MNSANSVVPSAEPVCSKCGCEDVGIRYHEGGCSKPGCWRCHETGCRGPQEQHHSLLCRRCGYEWIMAVLSFKEGVSTLGEREGFIRG